jgi:4-amino-4-deoxy-L-arabinose transferase-like glycosyltransferase
MKPDELQNTCTVRDALGDRWLLGLLASGLVVRIALVVFTADTNSLIADDRLYVTRAAALLATGELDMGEFVRPPLYFLFMAAVQFLFDRPIVAAGILQCLAGAAAAVPIYRAAHRIAGQRAARLAAGFLLFDPTLIAYCSLLWPETLFLLLVSVVFEGIGRLRPGAGWHTAALGILTGLAMLLKPVFGLFTLILAVWWVSRRGVGQAIRLCLVFGGAVAVVIAPWIIRNQMRYGPSIILENQVSYNLWVGNDPNRPEKVLWGWAKLKDPVVRNRVGMERGLAAIREDPARFLKLSAVRALNLWGLEYFVVRNLIHGGFGPVTRETVLAVFWIVQVGYVILLVCSAAGLGPAARDPANRLVLIYAIIFTLLVSTMVGTTRFRVPFGYLLSVTAGIGAMRMIERRISWRSLAMVVAVLIMLALSASRPVFQKIGGARFEKVFELRNQNWYFFRY